MLNVEELMEFIPNPKGTEGEQVRLDITYRLREGDEDLLKRGPDNIANERTSMFYLHEKGQGNLSSPGIVVAKELANGSRGPDGMMYLSDVVRLKIKKI